MSRFAFLVSLLLLGCIAFALVREMSMVQPRPAVLAYLGA